MSEIPQIATAADLKVTNAEYDAKKEDWNFYRMAYEGGRSFVNDVLYRNERESFFNYAQRVKEAIYLNFPREIVDLYNFYLTEKEAIRKFGELAEDPQWEMFFDDADGFGMDYNIFFNECQKFASIYGIVGILVDKPLTDANTIGEEIRRGIYPYCSLYTPLAILDWRYSVDPQTGRSRLAYLKLLEGENQYYIWYLGRWERWAVRKNTNKSGESAELIAWGEHKLGCIPMVFMVNLHGTSGRNFGLSDLADIAPIAASIVRDMSCGDEIIKYAGFPMLRIPQEEAREDLDGDSDGDDNLVRVGADAVLQFNPEYHEGGKPDWMESPVLDPIEAILKWVDRKSDEIYRICHLSGVHGQRKSNNEVASGLALRYEFQQLYSVLNKKAINMNEAERRIIYLWLLWQRRTDLMGKIEVRRAKTFSVDELAMNLENTIRAITNVVSPTFRRLATMKIVKQELPDISEKDYKDIEKEVGDNPDVPGDDDDDASKKANDQKGASTE